MLIEANTKSKYLKFKKDARPCLSECVGRLALTADRPEETQLLRYLYEAMHPYRNHPARISIDIDGKQVFAVNYKPCVTEDGKEPKK